MASTITADNGVSSGSAGLKTAADSTGVLTLRTTTAGGTATTAMTISNTQVADFVNTPTVNGTPIGGSSYAGPGGQVFTANGTFTIPSGITKVKATVVGGGGGGGGGSTFGLAGGSSSISSGTQTITTVTGGGGGGTVNGTTATGTNGDINIAGGRGDLYLSASINCGNGLAIGVPGTAYMFTTSSYGAGGVSSTSQGFFYSSGAGAGSAVKYLTGLTPGNTISVTVGAAGAAGSGGTPTPTAGKAGIVIFEW